MHYVTLSNTLLYISSYTVVNHTSFIHVTIHYSIYLRYIIRYRGQVSYGDIRWNSISVIIIIRYTLPYDTPSIVGDVKILVKMLITHSTLGAERC